jgi:hypothetical protein
VDAEPGRPAETAAGLTRRPPIDGVDFLGLDGHRATGSVVVSVVALGRFLEWVASATIAFVGAAGFWLLWAAGSHAGAQVPAGAAPLVWTVIGLTAGLVSRRRIDAFRSWLLGVAGFTVAFIVEDVLTAGWRSAHSDPGLPGLLYLWAVILFPFLVGGHLAGVWLGGRLRRMVGQA